MTHWFEPLAREAANPSDRALAIVAASMLEQLLRDLLAAHLCPVGTSNDSLLDGATAPISTFSARIDLCHRTGLISPRLARDLHLVRRIRNEFAHTFADCHFADGNIKSRVLELSASHGIFQRNPSLRRGDARDEFFVAATWMAAFLSAYIEDDVEPFSEAKLEWGYTTTAFEDPSHDHGGTP